MGRYFIITNSSLREICAGILEVLSKRDACFFGISHSLGECDAPSELWLAPACECLIAYRKRAFVICAVLYLCHLCICLC